ncbi:putative membrane protein [Neisseria musculi]|uniref:Membrane protein n=1 Tax=Neisseria musculi TaxID=1815583 RepID=A0A7H1MAS9_9NEIS|nr:putative membrane protein [Neisseria musculi]
MQTVFLLLLGKLQDSFQNRFPAWCWAVVFALFSALWSMSGNVGILIAGSVISGLYAWGYFVLLRKLSDRPVLWLAVYAAGGVLPFLLLPMVAP